MLANETVLILGAGASADLDIPLGHELIFEIAKVANRLADPIQTALENHAPSDWRVDEVEMSPGAQVRQLQGRLLNAAPRSIDRFLEENPSLANVGRLAIAGALLPKERPDYFALHPKRSIWYQWLWGEVYDVAKSWRDLRLSIITLNYDRTIESFLRHVCQNFYEGLDSEAVDKIVSKFNILHLHGDLGPLDRVPFGGTELHKGANLNLKRIAALLGKSAAGIKLMHEGGNYREAQGLLSRAKVVCFLGFGFHRDVMNRLFSGPAVGRPAGQRAVIYGSSKGMTEAERAQVKSFFGSTGFSNAPYIDLHPGDCRETLRAKPVITIAPEALGLREENLLDKI